MNAEEVAVVTEGDEVVSVVLQPTESEDGWEALSTNFDMMVRAQAPNGDPVPLAKDRRLAVPQGGVLQTSGDGYAEQSVVRVFLVPRSTARSNLMPRAASGAIYLGETTVDNTGAFTADFTVPMGVSVGDYVLQINGLASSLAVRSVNMGVIVESGAPMLRAGMVQRAGFYKGFSDDLRADGERKLRAITNAVPADAQAVQVLITGVSVGLEDFEDNVALAGKRAAKLAKQLKGKGITGAYVVNVTATFTVDSAERSLVGQSEVLTTRTGKPLSTVTVLFKEPA